VPIVGVVNNQVTIDGVLSTKYFLEVDSGLLYPQETTKDLPGLWDTSSVAEYISVSYSGGFATIPEDIRDVVLSMVRSEFLGRQGDPSKDVKFESVPDAVSTSYFDNNRVHAMLGKYANVLDPYAMSRIT